MQTARVLQEAVAHEREAMGERQELRKPGQETRQRRDREERPGEEPGQDRDRRQAGDVLLLLGHAAGEELRHPVHPDCEQDGGTHEPADTGHGRVEVDSPRPDDCDQDGEL